MKHIDDLIKTLSEIDKDMETDPWINSATLKDDDTGRKLSLLYATVDSIKEKVYFAITDYNITMASQGLSSKATRT